MNLSDAILEALVSTLPAEGFKPLHEPCFEGREWEYVKECLDTGWVSTAGKFVDRFESMLQEFTGARRAVAVVNGTAALHAALALAGVEAGDEVVMPALTFVATANAVAYIGATPHFVDCEESSLSMNSESLAARLEAVAEIRDGACVNKETGRRISAVVPMHAFGHAADLDGLLDICGRYGLVMVEDSAESLGSYYRGRHTGLFGLMGILSFNGNKTVTTGGGGAILTNDEALADRAKHVTTTAKLPHKWEYVHDRVGFNYRLPNINAALGCAQMEVLPDFLARKRRLAEAYARAFDAVNGVRFVTEPEGRRSNYWLNALLLDEDLADLRDEVLEKTNAAGVMTRPAWTLMHRLAMYQDCPRGDLSVSESLERRLINIPSGPKLHG
ncbi:MAG: perosamine synthetase [Desulfovibrionales bacterium]|nr:perosamine synthetase [Desulfovibrionales bacterium]